jgi:hypothetical protein
VLVREGPTAGPDVQVVAETALLDAVVREAVQAAVRLARSAVSWSCATAQDRAVLTLLADAPPGTGSPSAPADLGLAVARRLAVLLGGSLSSVHRPDGALHLVLELPGAARPRARRGRLTCPSSTSRTTPPTCGWSSGWWSADL